MTDALQVFLAYQAFRAGFRHRIPDTLDERDPAPALQACRSSPHSARALAPFTWMLRRPGSQAYLINSSLLGWDSMENK
ncbi:hypothetical protein NDU88_000379 [Pleurodeles waltl]|uniref:Uncharacterized protein n=1 Tax=Pleurodeles waltl TaxID=8319 RepID=A0AAV7TGZ7_PLEWA|nr:hypothetical protein NDU88_000379 [Pleurodeles waltl]